MNQYIQIALSFWRGLNQREQILLGSGSIVLLLTIIYLSVWEPLVVEQDRLQMSIARQQKDVDWMRNAAAEVRKLNAQRGPVRQINGQSMLGVIDSTAKQNRLGESVTRIEPEGGNSVRVWLEAAPFDDMMRWLQKLTREYSYNIDSVVIEKEAVSGRVSVRLIIAGAAK